MFYEQRKGERLAAQAQAAKATACGRGKPCFDLLAARFVRKLYPFGRDGFRQNQTMET
jgi:hypothetical protein